MKAKDVIKGIEEGFDDNKQIADAVEWVEDAANRLADFEQDNHMQAIKIEKLQAELAALKAERDQLSKACDQHAAHEYKLMGEVAALKAAQEWRAMESAPKDGTWVLVIDSEYGDHGGAFVARYTKAFSGSWLINTSHTPHVVYPTHWMPLPGNPHRQSQRRGVIYDRLS